MARKNINWKTKGMNRDMSVSAFNPEFAFENINLRLSTNDGNTMMSWVNEKGTKELNFSISKNGFNINNGYSYLSSVIGVPIGTAIIDHKLILFTYDKQNLYGADNYIFSLKMSSDGSYLTGKVLYAGYLGMDDSNPLETLASYESEKIQKVYWVDGKNQPRMVNVTYDGDPTLLHDTSFDFIQTLALKEDIEVSKVFGSGEFPAGVIQYAFTYYNKYGQESNIFYTTPLQYISYMERGGSPDSKIANAFKIGISNIDSNFDYLRIYSILRTSKNATPLCKRVADIPLREETSSSSGSKEVNSQMSLSNDGVALLSSTGSNLDDFGKTMKVSMIAKFEQTLNGFYVQGAAAYGKYMFQAYIAGKYIDVIDMETKERIATLTTNITYDFAAYHGNVLSFGKDIASGSEFPYLYYSCESSKSPCILVIKIIHSGSSWTGQVVNRLYLPTCVGGDSQTTGDGGEDWFVHYYQNGCVDAENNCIWVSGYLENSYDQNSDGNNALEYRKYSLPSILETDIYYTAQDVQETITLPFKKSTQGMVIKDNKLYQCFGYDKNDIYDEYLDCIDLSTGKIIHSYNFPKDLLKDLGEELESPFIYNGNLYLSATCNYKPQDTRYYTLWSISFSDSSSGGDFGGDSGGDSGGGTGGGEVIIPPEPAPSPIDPTTKKYAITYIDDGLHGETIDPTELLYKGGEEIIAKTLCQKDDTLFFGNIKIKRPSITSSIKNSILGSTGASQSSPLVKNNVQCKVSKRPFSIVSKSPFTYLNTLSSPEGVAYQGASGFKSREYYRLGVQFQYKDGKWSEPCWIGDMRQTYCPEANEVSSNGSYSNKNVGTINVPEFEFILSGVLKELYSLGYRKARPVFVQPSLSDRTVLCQGVACPTMYIKSRRDAGNLYAQSSWLFRTKADLGNSNSTYSGDASDGGGKVCYSGRLYSQFDLPYIYGTANISPWLRNTEIMGYFNENDSFYVDQNTITIHSPETVFDTSFNSMDFNGFGIRFIGGVGMAKTYGDIDIQTSTPPIGSDSAGFVHRSIVTDGYAALISAPFYNDYLVDDIKDSNPMRYEPYHTESPAVDFPVYMWHKNGSLNNDINRTNRSAELLMKRISNYRLGSHTYYYQDSQYYSLEDLQLFSSDELSMVKLNGNVYMGNIDTLLTPSEASRHYFIGSPYRKRVDTNFTSDSYFYLGLEDPNNTDSRSGVWRYERTSSDSYKEQPPSKEYSNIGDAVKGLCQWREPVRMKYKSTPHLVAKIGTSIFSYASNGEMPLVEISREYDGNTIFGGTSSEALQAASWIPCGPPVSFTQYSSNISLDYKWGDTFYQRYECLKTYPYTTDDKNQVIEIASFMCETRVNIDGRYDRNRAQSSNLNMTPRNFNLINPVYSQMDNFFSYRILDKKSYENTVYPNTVTWTKTKENGADIDLWTNITLANTLELDGNKGEITKLTRLNNQLLAFQDSGISQILYNENTQISTSEGVPIEIANSQKVQGKRYLSDTVGCSNKWSMTQTPMGIYFMDSNEKSIYLFNGQLSNLSTIGGFNSWCKQHIPSVSDKWTPSAFGNFVTYYDKLNQDVLFINKSTALAYSEKFNCFTSFYDYGGAPYLEYLDDVGIWMKDNRLWKHQAGNYCKFFGENKPFSMTLIANQEPQLDKIFTNLEFRACVNGEGTYNESTDKFVPSLPFDSLEAWDEYQHGKISLSNKNRNNKFTHGLMSGILSRKFRIWNCDIPRDNATVNAVTEAPLGIKRFKARPLDRIRNTWAYIKLHKGAAEEGKVLSKTEVHDIMASYFA